MKQILNEEFKGTIFFIGEIINFTAVIIGSIIIFWLYAPFDIGGKILISIIGVSSFYSLMKNFIYVRYILWKESLKNKPIKDYGYELKKP